MDKAAMNRLPNPFVTAVHVAPLSVDRTTPKDAPQPQFPAKIVPWELITIVCIDLDPKPDFAGSHVAPSSDDLNIPPSVPAKRLPLGAKTIVNTCAARGPGKVVHEIAGGVPGVLPSSGTSEFESF
jgi:hypothetical protein